MKILFVVLPSCRARVKSTICGRKEGSMEGGREGGVQKCFVRMFYFTQILCAIKHMRQEGEKEGGRE